jgi:hypothetical protein
VAGRGTVYPRPATVDDATGAAPTKRRHRLLGWLLGGGGALLLLIAGGIGVWLVANDPDPRPSPTGVAAPTASRPATPTASAVTISPGAGGLVLPGCLALRPEHGRCPDKLECFGSAFPEGGVLTAPVVPCAGRHTWEAYAVGELPDGTRPAVAGSNPAVRRLCNEGNFRIVSLRLDAGWRFEVLPPGQDAYDSGERTYRCLAGKGLDRLNGPTLAR